MTEQPKNYIDEYGNKRWYLPSKGKEYYHRLGSPAVEGADNKTKLWYVNSKLHRLDGPAAEFLDGTKLWYVNGKRHRLDGPAAEWRNNGRKLKLWGMSNLWYVNDKLHRLDGPAIEYTDGSKKWYVDGERHRLDGPAVEWAEGTKMWYKDGELHRLDGPAMEMSSGTRVWLIHGKYVDRKEIETWIKEGAVNLSTKEGQMALESKWIMDWKIIKILTLFS